MAWDTSKVPGDLISSADYNSGVTDQKARVPYTGATGSVDLNAYDLNNIRNLKSNLSVSGSYGYGVQTGAGWQYITIPDNAAYYITTSFTINLWVKFTSLPVAGGDSWFFQSFIAQDEGGGLKNKWGLGYDTSNGKLAFLMQRTSSSQAYARSSSWTPTLGTWYMISLTRNGSTFSFYVNGVATGTATSSYTLNNVAAPITIGMAETNTVSFDGMFDEIGLWNGTILTTGELLTLYGSGYGTYGNVSNYPFNTNFVLGLHLDENTGTTTDDFSTTANDGTLVGSPTWVTGKVGNPSSQPVSLVKSENTGEVGIYGINTFGDDLGHTRIDGDVKLNYYTTNGYLKTINSDGTVEVDTSPPSGIDHSTLTNLNWADAGHTMDTALLMNSQRIDFGSGKGYIEQHTLTDFLVIGTGAYDEGLTLFVPETAGNHFWYGYNGTEEHRFGKYPYNCVTIFGETGNLTSTGIITGGTLTDGTASFTAGNVTGATGNISMWTNDVPYLTTISGLDHSTLTNLTWSTAGHTMDADLDMTTNSINRLYLITDTSAVTAVDVENRNLYDSSVVESMDWENRTLIDDDSAISVNWNDRDLLDTSALKSIEWQDRQLVNSSEQITMNWQNSKFYNVTDGSETIDWYARRLRTIDSSDYDSVDWGSDPDYSGAFALFAAKSSGEEPYISLNWRDCICYDNDVGGETKCLNWRSRILYGSDGTTVVLNWTEPTYLSALVPIRVGVIQDATTTNTVDMTNALLQDAQTSIDWTDRKLYDTTGTETANYSGDFKLPKLTTDGFVKTINSDGTLEIETGSVGITAHDELTNLTWSTAGHTIDTAININNQDLGTGNPNESVSNIYIDDSSTKGRIYMATGSGNFLRIDVNDAKLYDNNGAGVVSIDWGNTATGRSLLGRDGQQLFSWDVGGGNEGNFNNPTVTTNLDVQGAVSATDLTLTNGMIYKNGDLTIDIANRKLYDGAEVGGLDWENKSLIDNNGVSSIDWHNRYLQDFSGNTIAYWNASILDVLNSLSVGEVIAKSTCKIVSGLDSTKIIDAYNRKIYNSLDEEVIDFSGSDLKLPKLTTDGYLMTSNSDGTIVVLPSVGFDHSTLTNLEWSVAGHTIDATLDMVSNDISNVGTVTATTLTDGTASLTAGSLTGVKLGSLTDNGFVTTSGSDGTLGIDTSTYLTSVSGEDHSTLSNLTWSTAGHTIDTDLDLNENNVTDVREVSSILTVTGSTTTGIETTAGANSYVSIPHDAKWDFQSNNFTINMWVYYKSVPTNYYDEAFISHDGNSGYGGEKWIWGYDASAGKLSLHIGPGADQIGVHAGDWTFDFASNLNRWMMVTIKRSGNTWTPYIDGVPLTPATSTLVMQSSTAPLMIGFGNEGESSSNAKFQEVGIWDSALSDATILNTLFNGGAGVYGDIGTAPFDANLIGGWHLQEGTGLNTDDFSSVATTFDGTLTNGATWITDGNVVNPSGTPPTEEEVNICKSEESATPGVYGTNTYGDKAGYTKIDGLNISLRTGPLQTERLLIEDDLITSIQPLQVGQIKNAAGRLTYDLDANIIFGTTNEQFDMTNGYTLDVNGYVNWYMAIRQLYNSANTGYLDYENGQILASDGTPSVYWNSRYLYSSASIVTVDWETTVLKDTSDYTSINWTNRTLAYNGNDIINWTTGLITDNTPVNSLNWVSRAMYDTSAITSLDWENRILKDNSGNDAVDYSNKLLMTNLLTSLDWENRTLNDTSGSEVLNWSNGVKVSGISYAITTQTDSYLATSLDDVIVINGTDKIVTLPTAVGIEGKVYTIKNINASDVTITPDGSETIDGETTQTISQWSAIKIISDGSQWLVI